MAKEYPFRGTFRAPDGALSTLDYWAENRALALDHAGTMARDIEAEVTKVKRITVAEHRQVGTFIAMPNHTYLFDMGNSGRGPIGYCARVDATSPEHAVQKLKAAMPEMEDVDCYTEEGGVELCVYFNDAFITARHAQDEGLSEPDDEAEDQEDDE